MVVGRGEVKKMSKTMYTYFGFMLLINIVPTFLTLVYYLELEEIGLKEVLLMYVGVNMMYSMLFWGIQLLKMVDK